MLTPTPNELRAASDLIAKKFPPSGPEDAKLQQRAAVAAVVISSLTFRLIEPVNEALVEGYTFVEVPAGLRPVAVRAVALMVEREIVTGEPAFAEQVATGRRLRGFSAGPYSESYFAPGEFARRGAQQGRPPMDPDEQLDQVLWALATIEAREYFVATATGIQAPAGVVTAFDYRKQAVGNRPGAVTGVFGAGGPDGW